MAKTQEELNALKEEVKTVNRKLHELMEEELEKVNVGMSTGATVQVKGEDIAKLNTTEALQGEVGGSSSNLIRRSARFTDAFSC